MVRAVQRSVACLAQSAHRMLAVGCVRTPFDAGTLPRWPNLPFAGVMIKPGNDLLCGEVRRETRVGGGSGSRSGSGQAVAGLGAGRGYSRGGRQPGVPCGSTQTAACPKQAASTRGCEHDMLACRRAAPTHLFVAAATAYPVALLCLAAYRYRARHFMGSSTPAR